MSILPKKIIFYITVVIAVLAFILFPRGLHQEDYTLVIGILSARSHFDHRSVLRKSFNNIINNKDVIYKFIVADSPCMVQPDLRLNEFSCEQSSLNLSQQQPSIEYLHEFPSLKTLEKIPLKVNEIQGVDFTVLQDIYVTHLGIYDKDQDGIESNSKVLIYDIHSREPVIGAVFLPFSKGVLFESFWFKKCSKQLLPKGFKGTLVVEGFEKDTLFFGSKCGEYLKTHVLEIEQGLRFGNSRGEFPINFIPHKSGCFFGASMNFTLKIDRDLVNEELIYQKKLEIEKLRLSLEMKEQGDIFLAQTTEVYRNLPLKMLQFYQYVSKFTYSFLLKTDDDCFVNIPGILALLSNLSIFQTSNMWVGNFRENFAIDQEGKWAEHSYPSISYPPFACGSGYILSKDIADWISANENQLKIFQGEDTSLGIWLAALNVNRIHDERFQCFHTCKDEVFSIPENSIENLINLYVNNGSCNFINKSKTK